MFQICICQARLGCVRVKQFGTRHRHSTYELDQMYAPEPRPKLSAKYVVILAYLSPTYESDQCMHQHQGPGTSGPKLSAKYLVILAFILPTSLPAA